MRLNKSELREKAEHALLETAESSAEELPANPGTVLHELRVHQEELKIQHETLQRAYAELDDARRMYRNLYKHYYGKYLDLYDNAPVGYCTVDKRGNIIDINRKGAELLGDAAETLRGASVYHFLPEHERDMMFLSLRRIFGAGLSGSSEATMQKRDGETFFARLDYSVSEHENSDERRCRLTIADITQNIYDEAALRESEEKFRTLVEEMAEGVFYQRPGGRLIDINPAAQEMLGVTYDQFVARTSVQPEWDVINEDGSRMKADDYPSVKASRTGKPVRNVTAGVYNPRRGGYVWLHINAIPQFRPDEATPYQVFVTIHDITDQKKAERKRALNEARLEALVSLSRMDEAPLDRVADFVLEGIVALTESRIGFVGFMDDDGEAMILHAWSEEALAECDIKDQPLHFKIADAGLWAEAIRQRRPFTINAYDAAHPGKKGCPSGHVRIDRFLSVPILEDGRIVVVAAVGNKAEDYDETDIRQVRLMGNGLWRWVRQREAERQIQASLEEKELLLREIHHRAKNSLDTVISMIHICGQQTADPHIHGHFRDLRNRIMAMSRVHETLYRAENVKTLDVGVYLEKVAADIQTSFARVPAKMQVDAHDIHLSCDTAMLCGRIVAELVTNAFKYAFPGPEPADPQKDAGQADAPVIRVEMRQEAGQYRLTVADNGGGLPPGHDVRKVETLGMNLVQSWAEQQLQGEMAVSGPPGTVFTITFPA